MNKATFLEMTAQEIDTVVPMMADFYAIDNYPFDMAAAKTLLEEFVSNQSLGRGWLILDGRIPVGYVILTFVFSFEYKGRIAFLDELFIAPEARGKGFGKQTVDFIAAEAKNHSVKIIYLEVEHHNEAARSLYLSKNYTAHNRGLMKLVL